MGVMGLGHQRLLGLSKQTLVFNDYVIAIQGSDHGQLIYH